MKVRKPEMRTRMLLSRLAAVLLAVPALWAQAPAGAEENKETNFKAYVELMRKDIKTEKVAIMTELMSLDPAESAKFWPVYNAYDKELTRLGDERLALFRMYIENYSNLTDQQATTIVNGLMDVQAKRNVLQKKYFQQMSQALSPKLAARFVQIEHQLLLVLDLQVAASLPVVD